MGFRVKALQLVVFISVLVLPHIVSPFLVFRAAEVRHSNVEPPAPEEFRVLRIGAFSPAIEALSSLQTQGSHKTARLKLVAAYREAGFLGASRFFENTVRVLEGKSLLYGPVNTKIAWAAAESEAGPATSEAAFQVFREASQGDIEAALAMAESELEESYSLQMSVEWAFAVVSMVILSPNEVAPEKLEPALRIFLTSLLERVPKPLGVDSPTTGFETLANCFLAVGDDASSLTAARLALHALDNASEPYLREGGAWRGIVRERLLRKIGQLEEKLGSSR
jgi:hypothetical protein